MKGIKPATKNGEVYVFVIEALESKLSGHESLAARVLSSWGRADDKDHLKRWLSVRILNRTTGFRPDILEVCRCLTDDADVAFLMHAFRESRSLRTTVGHVLRDLPEAHALALELIEDGDPQQAADGTSCLMWSRKRYGRSLRVLKEHPNALVRAAAEGRRKLFHRCPDLYP